MLILILTSLLTSLAGADAFGVAVLSQKTGHVRASAVLIAPHAALTAAHATDEAGSLATLRCSNTVVHGIVTRRSVLMDLALVEFEEDCSATVAELATKNPPVGADLTVVGYPGGEFLSVTRGIVSLYDLIGAQGVPRYALISDAKIFPGSSGGPVFTEDGVLVGIVTGRVCFKDDNQPSECWSSSVPASLIKLFLTLPTPG